MAYIKGSDRRQRVLFPDCIDEYVEADAPVRLFDAFVDRLKMDELGFIRSTPAETGTPGYDPRDLLKLYIYGYFYQVRSSRKLARECKCNVEVMWLLSKLTPDFRTISDFRKDNKEAITKVYKEFNKFCMRLKLFSKSYISIDGSKFKAVNAKDNNFTLSKLDDRIKRLDEHISIYMEELDVYDQEEGRKLSKDEIQRKLDVCKERKERYEGYRNQLEESGDSQISLTDTDSRLMKTNEGFCVGYNVQTAVDAESHMIAGFQVTNNPTDHGQITSVASEVKVDYDVPVLETTADKGYECPEDHADALANGIIPNVIQRDGGCTEQVQFDYNEATITDEQKASTKPEDLKACLEAGVIPDVYEGILTDAQTAEVKELATDVVDSAVLKMTPEQMRAKALEGYFVRDAERNLVYCPQGEILRQKSIKRNGMIRYCNKLACKKCKCKCTAQRFKEVDFNKDTLIKATEVKRKQLKEENKDKPKPPRTKVVKKVVRYVLHLDQNKMDNRKCLSEHPFGTIKRTLGQYYFLLKGFAKVGAEMGLFCLSYNLRRAISLRGVPVLVAALR
ncbi:MAG: transposase [Prevotellaceae bacterium]|nr:transposase [Prevotellaceae bacterium]